MIPDDDVKRLLEEVREIVLRHEQVNRKDADFRRRILIVLLAILAVAVLAMGYVLILVHMTTREIRQQQRQQQQKVAVLPRSSAGILKPRFNIME